MPVAGYLITFSTYGSHHHGDDRGSFRANAVVQRTNDRLVEYRRSLMTAPPMALDAAMRNTVLRAIVATCAFRAWILEAAHIRTEHAHLVVRTLDKPELVMTACKAWSTRYLREASLVDGDARVWARHGSTRWLWNDDDV